MRQRLFVIGLSLTGLFAVVGIVLPVAMEKLAGFVLGPVFEKAGWLVLASTTAYLVVALLLALGPTGRIRLGGDDDRPEFSTGSWLAMLFCAGMGLGLVFFGVAEPVLHYANPPSGAPLTDLAARRAIVLASVNWGVHGWGVFALSGLAIGYFAFNRGLPYLPSAPIQGAFTGRWVEPVALAADLLAILAVAVGVAGSISMAVMQFNSGLHHIAGVSAESNAIRLVAMTALIAAYCLSAATGLHGGIKWLSNINTVLALLVLVVMLFVGPTTDLLASAGRALLDYPAMAARLTLRLEPYDRISEWMKPWTLTFLIWFIAWTPFVAVFIARISRGRTIREFVFGVLFMPTVMCTLWFAVFGGTGLHEEIHGAGGLAAATGADMTVASFALFQRLPLGGFLSVASLILLMVFTITSVDSATFVLGMLTSDGSLNPPRRRRIIWGVGLGLLGTALMLLGRMEVLRAVAISAALPFTIIVIIQGVALVRALRADRM